MGFKSSVRVDRVKLDALKKAVKRVDKTNVEYGWINRKKYPKSDKNGRGGIYIADIAARNNYGAYVPNLKTMKWVYITARSYIEQAVEMSIPFNRDESEALFHRICLGLPYKHILYGMAEYNVQILKDSIARQNMTPLKEKTVEIKGNNTQWDDTGVLMKNITGRVIYRRNDSGGN